MIRERLSPEIEKKTGPSHGRLFGGALAMAVAGLLLETTTVLAAESPSSKAKLLIGAATADITPELPTALTGFQTVRIARTIQSPLTANVLALESRQGERTMDQAILVSCDLCVIRPGIQEEFRKQVAVRLPGFDVGKLFLAATHTHSAQGQTVEYELERDSGSRGRGKGPRASPVAPRGLALRLMRGTRDGLAAPVLRKALALNRRRELI